MSPAVSPSADSFAMPPDPGQSSNLDDVVEQLRLLKVWAGDPSYERITDRINATWGTSGRPTAETARKNTVADCFKTGRRRVNTDLLIAVVQALHPDVGYVTQWRQALRVVGGETQAASQVRVQDTLPLDVPTFTGRTGELDQLRQAVQRAQQDGEAVVVSAIEGMAGVGKTQLAVHAGHLLTREKAFTRTLFVNLRGFHPDPAQPPADAAAVLDGFLRLLGVPGQQIPHDLPGRTAAYRERLTGNRTLVVLDNAADAEQVRPLLAAVPGCLTLITSRRSLADLRPAAHLSVDVFTPGEAAAYLIGAVPEVPVGSDPDAAARIALRCGHLPLALVLVAGHIRGTSGWTLTDHADRLDERHGRRQLETGVELALDLSYQHLQPGHQRLLRLAALHPGQDFDAHAAAALSDVDHATAEVMLAHLHHDHLLQQATPGRFSFHDLVRAYATGRASDQDPPPQRRSALTRLFDHYVVTTATATNLAYPHERHRRPRVASTAAADRVLSGRDEAEQCLDTELANLLAAAQHTAEHGWPHHSWQLSALLNRHVLTRGRHHDAETLHQQALTLARDLGDRHAEMDALNSLGEVRRMRGSHEQAEEYYQQALQIAQEIGDSSGELQALSGLGSVHRMRGNRDVAAGHFEHAQRIARQIGDGGMELQAFYGLGHLHRVSGRFEQAIEHFGQALRIAREIGDRRGELYALSGLGDTERTRDRHEPAAEHFGQALRIAQELGDRRGELYALTGLGHTSRLTGHHDQAAGSYSQALRIAQEIGDHNGELYVLIGLGQAHRALGSHTEAAGSYRQALRLADQTASSSSNWQYEALQGLGRLHQADGRPADALTHHEQALEHATKLAQPTDQARAHDGLAHAHRDLHHHDQARRHWQQALEILTSLGTNQTDDVEASIPSIRAHLAELASPQPST